MNIMATLHGFIGKELDDALIQFITTAFDAQHRHMDQLKESNTTLQQEIMCCTEKITVLEHDNEALRNQLHQSEVRATTSQQAAPMMNKPSVIEKAIMASCMDAGITGFCSEDMVLSLPYSRLDITSAIDQLERKGVLEVASLAPNGTNYLISAHAEIFEQEIEKQDYSY